MLGFDKHCFRRHCDLCFTGHTNSRLAVHWHTLHWCLLAIYLGGRLMFDADKFTADLYSETVDDIINNSLPCNDPSCSYDSGWVDADDKTLLSYSYITLDI